MKKILLSAAAAAMMLASCQEETFDTISSSDEVVVSLNASTPEAIALTRAYGDETNSAKGALTNVNWDNYNLRYVLEIWDAEGENLVKERMTEEKDVPQDATFNIRITPGHTYKFVLWADVIDADGKSHYDITDLKNILVDDHACINDESHDAYTLVQDIYIENDMEKTLTLTRPFGKIRVVTTDLKELKLGSKPQAVKVAYNATRPAAYNAFTGEVSGELSTVEHTAVLSQDTYVAGHDAIGADGKYANQTLFVDYILATNEQKPVNFELTAYEDTEMANVIRSYKFDTDIPVQRNYLTTIMGNVLTTATEFTITIDEAFQGTIDKDLESGNINISDVAMTINGETAYYAGLEEALAAIGDNETAHITLAAKETYTKDVFYIGGSKNVTIEGLVEGVTIDGQVRAGSKANVTLKGLILNNANATTNGKIGGNGNGASAMAKHAVSITSDASVTIEDCTFELNAKDGSGIHDWWTTSDDCKVTVKNSTFNCYGQRPMQTHINADVQNCVFNEPYRYVMQINSNTAATIVMKNNKLVKNTTTNDKPAYFIQLTHGGSEATDYTQNKTFDLSNNTFEGNSLFVPYVYEYGSVKAETFTVVGSTFANTFMEIDNPAVTVLANGLTQDNETKAFSVSNADGLEALNGMFANKSAGRNAVVNITADIDFSGKTWTPVDSHADTKFWLSTINGNGHTISNLTVNGQAMFTRFAGTGDVLVKDLTFDKATVISSKLNTSILTVQTYQNTTLENVDVKNSSISGNYKVAPLIATVYDETANAKSLTLKDCDVVNTIVKGNLDFMVCGMVAWVATSTNETISFENCTVDNVTLQVPADSESYGAVGFVYSTNGAAEDTYSEAEGVTVTNCKIERY